MHYGRLKRHGVISLKPSQRDARPAIVKGKIAYLPLGIGAKDGYALIDVSDIWVDKYKWCLPSSKFRNDYPTTNIDGKSQALHRLLMGKQESGVVIDHINRDKLDNRRKNLRLVTPIENSRNRTPIKSSRSGVNGVIKLSHGWRAQIWDKNRQLLIGNFTQLGDAVLARENAEKVLWNTRK